MTVKAHQNPKHIPKPTDRLTITMSRRMRDQILRELDNLLQEELRVGIPHHWSDARKKRHSELEYMIRVLVEEKP